MVWDFFFPARLWVSWGQKLSLSSPPRYPPSTADLNSKGAPTLNQPTGFPSVQPHQQQSEGLTEISGEEYEAQKEANPKAQCFPQTPAWAVLSPPRFCLWMTPGESSPILLKIGFNGKRNSLKEGITGAVRGPRGWGSKVGEPICIFSINKLELSKLARGGNLRGKSLHILFKSTLR